MERLLSIKHMLMKTSVVAVSRVMSDNREKSGLKWLMALLLTYMHGKIQQQNTQVHGRVLFLHKKMQKDIIIMNLKQKINIM